jgi:hypothetical protein
VQKLRADAKTAANAAAFKTAISNLGDEHAYLDGPEFQKFWDVDAKRVEDAVSTIGRIQG